MTIKTKLPVREAAAPVEHCTFLRGLRERGVPAPAAQSPQGGVRLKLEETVPLAHTK